MYSHPYAGRKILRKVGTQPRKAEDLHQFRPLPDQMSPYQTQCFSLTLKFPQTYLARAENPPVRSFKADNQDFFFNLQSKISTLW